MKFTTIGHFDDAPHEPLLFVVEADSQGAAIGAAEDKAHKVLPKTQSSFINIFVFADEPELLSSWAG